MTRALVLSGGGPSGSPGKPGCSPGWPKAAFDLAKADYILGTSAGSFVGSQLAMGRKAGRHGRPRSWRRPTASAPRSAAGSPPRSAAAVAAAPNLGLLFQKMQEAALGRARPARRCAARSASSRSKPRPWTRTASSRASAASSASPQAEGWPERGYACTAVDAETGEFVLWNAESKVGLARAVASSCSVPGVYPPITINGRRYIDGGMRSGSNADLATGHELVVVVGLRTAGDAEMSAQDARAAGAGDAGPARRRRPHRADPAGRRVRWQLSGPT